MSVLFPPRVERAATAPARRELISENAPVFLSADDAARYVHELIGAKRDVEYGGVILKNPAGGFVATMPIKGQRENFNFGSVLPSNAQGDLVVPRGYQCAGFYHSHPNNYQNLRDWLTSWSDEAIHTMNSFFSPPDLEHAIRNRAFANASYLSGLNGSLLKYVPSGSPRELALAASIREELKEEYDHSKKVLDLILPAVKAGAVSVIQSSEVWHGKVGRIDQTFKIYSTQVPVEMSSKVLQQPAYSQIFGSLMEAVEFAHKRVYQQPEHQYGYLIKVQGKPQYLATEPVVGADTAFDTDKVFKRDESGAVVIPAPLTVVGLYYCDGLYRAPANLPPDEVQIYKNFIEPQALANGVRAAKELRFGNNIAPLPLYIASRDGALLAYHSVNGNMEETYLGVLTRLEADGQLHVGRELIEGSVTPTAFIRAFAQFGELNVLSTSDTWGTKGKVGKDWTAFSVVDRRFISPLFISADDAARYVHGKIRRASPSEGIYGGLIFQRLDNRFVATEPLLGHNETFDPANVMPSERPELIPHGCSVAATYHSHRPARSDLSDPGDQSVLYRNMLEPHEVSAAIKDRTWAATRYLSAPGGALIKYSPSGSEEEVKLSALLAAPAAHPDNVRHNQLQFKLRANTLKPSAYVVKVAQAGDLQVVEGSVLWGAAGKVTSAWRPRMRATVQASVQRQPGFSPIFTQAADAMRYIHQQMKFGTLAQLGVVLRSTHSEEYVATLPVPADVFSLERVFAKNEFNGTYVLPATFQFTAAYVAAPKLALNTKGMDTQRIYEAFLSPVDMAKGLAVSDSFKALTGFVNQAAVLYLSTSDKALLRYIDTDSTMELASGLFKNEGKDTLAQLTARKLTPLEYVRKVAMAGELSVITTNGVWPRAEKVSAAWQAFGAGPLVGTGRDLRFFAMSPVFSHADDAAHYVHRRLTRPQTVNLMTGLLHHADYDTYVAFEPMDNGEPMNVAQTILKTHLVVPGSRANYPVLPEKYGLKSLHFARDVRTQSSSSAVETNLLKNSVWAVDICYSTRTLKREFEDNSFEFIYVSTDDGALLRYWRGSTVANNRLCEYVSGANITYEAYFVENGKAFQSRAIAEPLPSSQLTRVLNSGGLRVLVTSPTWSEKGVVGKSFTIRSGPATNDLDVGSEGSSSAPHDEL